MFGNTNTQNKVDKILGNKAPIGHRMDLGFQRANFQVNPAEVMQELQKVLANLPAVKAAVGDLKVTFADGQTKRLAIIYN